jgi:GxxExxY protein
MSKVYAPMSAHEEELGHEAVQAAYAVHRTLGPGLLESVYETCFCHELHKRGVPFQRQVGIPINYDGIQFEEGLRLDVLLDNLVICELKAVECLLPVHQAQLLSQLKLARRRLGFLINFNVPLIKDGIHRLVI